jgi:hypothetical protein
MRVTGSCYECGASGIVREGKLSKKFERHRERVFTARYTAFTECN